MPNQTFIFPYSTVKETKQQQVWSNLQNGILFEDTQVFIPWATSYAEIDKCAEKRRVRGDRTEWFLGKHIILDGVNSFAGVTKWLYEKDEAPFSKIEEYLGSDEDGSKKFIALKEKLTNLLGEPTFIEIEKVGDIELGTIRWENDKVQIRLDGYEQFACKYRLDIGWKKN